MRRFALTLFLSFATAATAAAQGFEGTITMKVSAATGAQTGDIVMKIATKGDMSATTMTMGASGGQMAGMEVRSIIDRKANTMTMLTPLPAGVQLPAAMTGGVDAKGMKIVINMSQAQAAAGQTASAPPDIKKLGTSETIAGMSCDDYEITPADGHPTRICASSALGAFTYPQAGGGMGGGRRGGAAAPPPAWAKAFGDKPMFPLKVWTTDGKVSMEVTAVDKGPVDASVFAIPDGYITMPGMGRGGDRD